MIWFLFDRPVCVTHSTLFSMWFVKTTSTSPHSELKNYYCERPYKRTSASAEFELSTHLRRIFLVATEGAAVCELLRRLRRADPPWARVVEALASHSASCTNRLRSVGHAVPDGSVGPLQRLLKDVSADLLPNHGRRFQMSFFVSPRSKTNLH